MNSSRRSFLKTAALALASVPVLGRLGVPAFAADADMPLAKEGVDPAKALKFCINADKPNKHCEPRKAKDRKSQYCYNCQLFTRIDGDKKKGTGKCMIMPKNRVTAQSWCMSWVQNPALKD
jgi:hypothetical protein